MSEAMKKAVLSVLVALHSAVLLAQFATPAEKPTAYLDVKEAAGENKFIHSAHGDIDKYASTTEQSVKRTAISISAGTLMHSPLSAHIEWYFIAKDLVRKRDYVFDKGGRDVSFQGGNVVEFDAVSKDISSSVTHETAYGMSELHPKIAGSKPDGWIVRILSGDTVLDMRASTPLLEDVANDPIEFQKLQGN